MSPESRPPGTLDLGGLAARQPEAVTRWFDSYFDVVHGFVRRRVARRPDLADDVAQETFLLALGRIADYDPDRGAMLPWLTYIARNCARKALRRQARLVGAIEEEASGGYPPLDAGPLPDELLDRAETADRVHDALAHLAPTHQHLLESHYVLQQPLKEIAVHEDATVSAVKSRLHRARLAFKAAFEALDSSKPQATLRGGIR
jgi:RNA polymerase sigma-70 factor, ECF subfamily